jgi:hypothetical protein
MTETAIVLYVKATGQVVATATRTSDPAAAPTPAELAGERFPVRDDTDAVVVEVAAAALGSGVVPYADDLLLNPQACGVTLDDKGEVESAGLLHGSAPSFTLGVGGVTVDVGATVTEKTPVWVQLDSGTGQSREHEVLTGEIPVGEQSVTLAKTLPNASYGVLALAKGLPPKIEERTGP